MPKLRNQTPDSATVIKSYALLRKYLRSFVEGHLSLLVIKGTPGLSKSKMIKAAIGNTPCLYIKGRKSPVKFYCGLYHHQDQPVILDDADNLMSQRLCKEYVRALTELDQYKRLDYDTYTKILQQEEVPTYFWTKSPVCLTTNSWNPDDDLCQALESRAVFLSFEPDWAEVYRNIGQWYYDQEIYDYLHSKLSALGQPDCRPIVKAYNLKAAGLPWQQEIDNLIDDKVNLTVRELMDDSSYGSNTARMRKFVTLTGLDRATFYRRLNKVKSIRPHGEVPRILLRHSEPIISVRPPDGELPIVEYDESEFDE